MHDVLAEIPEALELKSSLVSCNLSVYGSPDEFGTVGAKNSKRVTVGSFKRSLRHGIENVKLAAGLLTQAWPDSNKIQGELLEAVSILFKVHPSFSNGSKIEQDFRKWFVEHVAVYTQYNAASNYKIKGGRVHHKHGESMAHGMMKEYRQINLRDGCSVKHKQKFIKIKNTEDLLQ